MRLAVIIPDEAQLATAGVRIRYRRLQPHFEAAGHSLDLVPIDTFHGPVTLPTDICIFSKCHDARAPMMADMLRRAGVAVGIDIFDDYYSDPTDSRFVHLREWLRTIAPSLNFAICATPQMRGRLAKLLPDLPVHIVHDPYDGFDPEQIAQSVEHNLARTLATRVVEIGWFGIGDNPHFALGLSDLHAFGDELAGLKRLGFEPRLSILTNRRALDLERIEMIARLPVACRIEEWSEDLERRMIGNSLFCFLPVNAQPFSTAKSLNRAVTTLTGGAQAVGAGYPLYEPLGHFVYHDVATLMADVEEGRPALRRETILALKERLDRLGGPVGEANGLIRFLAGLHESEAIVAPRGVSAVIQGREPTGSVHKLAQRLGHLSVASPLSRGRFAYDVQLELTSRGPAVVLSEAACAMLNHRLRHHVEVHGHRANKPLSRISLASLATLQPFDLADVLECRFSTIAAARYRPAMEYLTALLRELFGEVTLYLSERNSPFWADVRSTFGQPRTTAASNMDAP
jgi:hypothetical protein